MIIREATEKDVPSIVKLLKLSLGESLMPKSEEYWRWKHIDNPFGRSPVLLAFEKDMLIGVRAFMRWEWKKGDKIIKAVRAVDTATHPNFQGKGIFRKLTMMLVDKCKEEGVSLVFNTPNQSSMPGYLKMGWKEIGSLSVGISINKPFNVLKGLISKTYNNEFLEIYCYSLSIPDDTRVLKDYNNWRTNYSSQYLTWRYGEIPAITYYSVNDEDTYLVFRIIRNTKGVELRVVDILGSDKHVRKLLLLLKGTLSFDFISVAGEYGYLLHGRLKKNIKLGPKVTIRSLNYDTDDFVDFVNWAPCLGDLEVF